MSDIAIKFENISKQYRLGNIGTGTLSHDLNRWWAMNIRGKEDPNLKIGQVNDRAAKSTGDYVWALRDIDFEVKQGEVLGIIGKNGAGKSTLLKILSRVTSPTTGRIMAHGRIASLLEVGTGFHPEMTGRENIYMNGAIMGMTKAEITRKLDEIIDFAGVEKYIDTPVKRYSSGMTVRLGFAIAAHLEPEILVVDEVLAVGDAEFQKKAIGKMQDVSTNDGRTVLFVSHNMGAIETLCKMAVELRHGKLCIFGSTKKVINDYINNSYSNECFWNKKKEEDLPIQIDRIEIGNGLINKNQLMMDDEINFSVHYTIKKEISNTVIAAIISSQNGQIILSTEDTDCNLSNLRKRSLGRHEAKFKIPSNLLNQGVYLLRLSTGKPIQGISFENIEAFYFTIISSKESFIIDHRKSALLMPFIEWTEKK